MPRLTVIACLCTGASLIALGACSQRENEAEAPNAAVAQASIRSSSILRTPVPKR